MRSFVRKYIYITLGEPSETIAEQPLNVDFSLNFFPRQSYLPPHPSPMFFSLHSPLRSVIGTQPISGDEWPNMDRERGGGHKTPYHVINDATPSLPTPFRDDFWRRVCDEWAKQLGERGFCLSLCYARLEIGQWGRGGDPRVFPSHPSSSQLHWIPEECGKSECSKTVSLDRELSVFPKMKREERKSIGTRWRGRVVQNENVLEEKSNK